jgi:hypothetical protein
VSEQLTAILGLNPGITEEKFEKLARDRDIGRNRARESLLPAVPPFQSRALALPIAAHIGGNRMIAGGS